MIPHLVRPWRSLLFVALALPFAGLALPVQLDSVILFVRNKAVTENEFRLAILQRLEERQFLRLPEISEAELRKEVMKTLVDNLLLLIRGEELKIEASQEEIAEMVENYKARNNLTQDAFEATLKRMEVSVNQFNRLQADTVVRQKLVSREVRGKIDIRREEILAAYEADGSGKIHRVRHLLRQAPVNVAEASKNKAREEIVFLIDQVEKGEEFKRLVKDYSEEANADRTEGILEFELANVIEPLREAVEKLNPGEFSGVVETPFGFHLIRLLEIKPKEKKPFEEVENDYRERIYRQRFQSLLEALQTDLRSRYEIVFNDPSYRRLLET